MPGLELLLHHSLEELSGEGHSPPLELLASDCRWRCRTDWPGEEADPWIQQRDFARPNPFGSTVPLCKAPAQGRAGLTALPPKKTLYLMWHHPPRSFFIPHKMADLDQDISPIPRSREENQERYDYSLCIPDAY